MVLCKACGRDLTGAKGSCPRCGFRPPAVIGDPEAAQALIAKRAVKHMKEFMQRLDVGVTVYLWKEQEDAVVSNGQQRLSFGTGDSLQEAPRFLEQKFSRVPDLAEMEVEISLMKDGNVLTEQTVSLYRLPHIRASVRQHPLFQQSFGHPEMRQRKRKVYGRRRRPPFPENLL